VRAIRSPASKAILSQDPYEVPTRRPKRSARPVFHFHSQEARESLWGELKAFIEEYRSAADALKAGEMDAIDRFPEGSYRPQLPFLGMPPTPRPPSPPTRPLEIEESDSKRIVGRGPVPVVKVGGRMRSGSPDHPT
jgi:hypothetical protein